MTRPDYREIQELYHYGVKHKSGRYPYGSGERPFQDREGSSRKEKKLKKKFDKIDKKIRISKNLEEYEREWRDDAKKEISDSDSDYLYTKEDKKAIQKGIDARTERIAKYQEEQVKNIQKAVNAYKTTSPKSEELRKRGDAYIKALEKYGSGKVKADYIEENDTTRSFEKSHIKYYRSLTKHKDRISKYENKADKYLNKSLKQENRLLFKNESASEKNRQKSQKYQLKADRETLKAVKSFEKYINEVSKLDDYYDPRKRKKEKGFLDIDEQRGFEYVDKYLNNKELAYRTIQSASTDKNYRKQVKKIYKKQIKI